MPPRRKSLAPAIDVDALRTAFAAGKIVRIGIAQSSQFPDGGVGRVRAIGDPDVDGDEYFQVEVNVGGGKDTVPFAPADLVPVQRGKLTAVPNAKPDAPKAAPSLVPTPRSGPSWADPANLVTEPISASRTPAAAAPKPKPASESAASGGPDAPAAKTAPAKPVRSDSARTRGKRAPVTITISTTGEDNLGWQVHAQQGSRTVVRASALPPVKAWELVSGLGNPDLTEFVAGILAEHRSHTEARAARLADELAALQAELAGYPGDGVQ